MQTTTHPAPERGQQFTLTAETAADRELLDAIDLHNTVVVQALRRTPLPGGGFGNLAVTLLVDSQTPQALEVQAGREALRALRELFRLGAGQFADQPIPLAPAANPQAQEQLAARLVELQSVVNALSAQVGQMKLVVEEVRSAHGASVGESAIVEQEGGAA